MALPDLAAPVDLSAALVATTTDPFMVEGVVDIEAFRIRLKAEVTAAALQHGEPLRPDWSNLFSTRTVQDPLNHEMIRRQSNKSIYIYIYTEDLIICLVV